MFTPSEQDILDDLMEKGWVEIRFTPFLNSHDKGWKGHQCSIRTLRRMIDHIHSTFPCGKYVFDMGGGNWIKTKVRPKLFEDETFGTRPKV